MAEKRDQLGNNDERIGTWSKEETLQLLNNIKKQLINWNAVKINGKTERDCKSHFQDLIRNIRNILSLMETLTENDIGEVTVEQDQKRQSQYPNRGRQKTSKPELFTPLQLFIKQKKEMGESNARNRLRTQYTNLEDAEKIKWIQMAVDKDEKTRDILSSDEKRILRGDPKKPLKNGHTKKTKSATKAHQQLTSEVDEAENVDGGGEQSTAPKKRKRRQRRSKSQTPPSTETPGKKARLVENDEPTRIPSGLYQYYKQFIHHGNKSSAKKAYHSLDPEKKKKIRKEHKRIYKSYCIKLDTYLKSAPQEELEELKIRIQEEEDNESSDPGSSDEDDNSSEPEDNYM